MNLILLFEEDLLSARHAVIRDQRRLRHIVEVHRAETGKSLKVGLLNGSLGRATVTWITAEELALTLELDTPAPAPHPLTLILGLPRPKMLKRVLQTVSTLGVQHLILVNSYRVEKSYWQSPLLAPEAIREQCILGLEQAGATQLPRVDLQRRFKPFAEDELPQICSGKKALVAHPYTQTPCPSKIAEPMVLAVGPEGGFIDYEITLLQRCGFTPVHLGNRIMRVETAVPYLLGRLLE